MHGHPKLAISIRQPWTHAVVQGWKPVENRTWSTAVRGPICLHASKFDKRNFNEDAADYLATLEIVRASIDVPNIAFDDLAFGAIVGVADLVDCVTGHASPWFFGPYGFVLANARAIEPIPLKGKQGFFEWRNHLAPDQRPAEVAPAQGVLL